MEGYVFDDAGLIDENGNIDYKSRPTNHIDSSGGYSGGNEKHI